MIKFSIICPSFLGDYPNSAKDKDIKFIRALESVLQQTFEGWELIIISDGCEKTVDLCKSYTPLQNKYDISLYKIPKMKRWGGIRNIGIEKATGQYIIYLDIDDYYFPAYLQSLAGEMKDEKDWYLVDDFKLKNNVFVRDNADLTLGRCGTSNIIHKREMKAKWLTSDYGEDWQFCKQLKRESPNYKKLQTVGYFVGHIPNKYDV